jgi:hypothetical protein
MRGCAKTREVKFAEIEALLLDKKKIVFRMKITEKMVFEIKRAAANNPIMVACD